jgi:RNA recognition motif-containing protein
MTGGGRERGFEDDGRPSRESQPSAGQNIDPAKYNLQMGDYAALKLRGLPFTSRPEDISSFFKDYDIHPDSIKIGRNQDNTKTGEGSLLFKDEEECKRAFREKQG